MQQNSSLAPAPVKVSEVHKLMGNRFELTVIAPDEIAGAAWIAAGVEEIRRIERMLTTFSDTSETFAVNEQAGIAPVKVSGEFLRLVKRAANISALTQGAFDITYGSIDKRFWNFDQQMTALPDPEEAREKVALINYRNVIVDETNHTIFLKERGMRIGFGGIGKGYAAEMAKLVLIEKGAQGGVVNASGDLTTWGTQADGSPWTIGIANPNATQQVFSSLNISNNAVATSGNYEKFVLIGGKKYSHTIDPKTGMPVTGIKSVTIICPNAEMADAMATPVTIMGIRAGLYLVNQLKGMACIIVDDNNKVYTSKNIHII